MEIFMSYNRVLEVEKMIAVAVSEHFGEKEVVIPAACLRKGLLTVWLWII